MAKFTLILALVALIHSVSAVTGAAEGFAKGVTGGGSAKPVYPSTTAELIKYLGDPSPRVIYLTKMFDFTGTEGTVTAIGCAPWGTRPMCQTAINANNWCSPSYPKVTVKYDKAATVGIYVKSNKSLIGVGDKGVLKGKGLRITNGVSNVIVQNVKITNLNPQYVWGGDAITLSGSDLVWIDRVTTSLVGRQHIVLGNDANKRVTISNSFFDGKTSWSPQCDTYHYWGLFFTGSNDAMTFKNNYIYHFAGRTPKIGGSTFLHAVNNYWFDNPGHAFEGEAGGSVFAEGNIIQNVKTPIEPGFTGRVLTCGATNADALCRLFMGRPCQHNGIGTSGAFNGKDTSIIAKFAGRHVASASTPDVAKNVRNTAGYGKI